MQVVADPEALIHECSTISMAKNYEESTRIASFSKRPITALLKCKFCGDFYARSYLNCVCFVIYKALINFQLAWQSEKWNKRFTVNISSKLELFWVLFAHECYAANDAIVSLSLIVIMLYNITCYYEIDTK